MAGGVQNPQFQQTGQFAPQNVPYMQYQQGQGNQLASLIGGGVQAVSSVMSGGTLLPAGGLTFDTDRSCRRIDASNPLAAIFNPQPSSYDPRKEQMLASMFGQQQPIRGWGDAIASGLKSIVAARGLNAQGKAREREDTEKQQALAQALGGVSEQLGIPGIVDRARRIILLAVRLRASCCSGARPKEAAAPPADPLAKPYRDRRCRG